MINAAIWGSGAVSIATKIIIEKRINPYLREIGHNQISVVCNVDFEKMDTAELHVISLGEFLSSFEADNITTFIIPREAYTGSNPLVKRLKYAGYDLSKVYITRRLPSDGNIDESFVELYLSSYMESGYLPYLEYHVVDHCNLNCLACEHYSPLADKKYTDYKKFEGHLKRLHQYIDDIGMIRIMGGEPLLNKELIKFVKLTANLYPYADKYVVSNGLLVEQMNHDLIDMLIETDTAVYISHYPPVSSKMDRIKSFFENKGIPYYISPVANCFSKKQRLTPVDDVEDTFLACAQAHCRNIYEGKLATCFMPFTTKYFNQYYDKSLPEDGGIDIYESGITTYEIKTRLLTPFERCRYCDPQSTDISWRTVSHPSPIENWIVD